MCTGHAVRVESQRFGKDYNEQLSQWREFWQEHQVPEAKHVKHSNFRQRLGNVFAIGAGTILSSQDTLHHDPVLL